MDEQTFWDLIAKLDWDEVGDDDAVCEPVIRALAALPEDEIFAFEDHLAEKLYALDTRAHAAAMGEFGWKSDDEPFSLDGFVYARCCVVANGPEAYAEVLADPQAMPKDMEFEALLNVAADAYELKTDDEWDYSAPVDYETFGNKAGWA